MEQESVKRRPFLSAVDMSILAYINRDRPETPYPVNITLRGIADTVALVSDEANRRHQEADPRFRHTPEEVLQYLLEMMDSIYDALECLADHVEKEESASGGNPLVPGPDGRLPVEWPTEWNEQRETR